MCLILFSYQNHPDYPLIIAANRDEFYSRPTLSANYWSDVPDILAGRDLEHGGAWLGVTKSGRFAALTNYRDPARNRAEALSRGRLAVGYLSGSLSATEYIETIRPNAGSYNGFNLLIGDAGSLWYYSNQTDEPLSVGPGIHGLSNHLLDTPWPKVERGKQLLRQALTGPVDEMAMLALLSDAQRPGDSQLPDTGVGLAMERVLSSIFIATEGYGTRAMSVLVFRQDGQIRFVERSRTNSGQWKHSSYQIAL
jgi:uncharacterized protein with NRDE domain